MHRSLILIAHNIRSSHNVGSLLRTAEGLGIREVILSGYTPYPDLALIHAAPACAYITHSPEQKDPRLPHVREKITRDIHKTALGAEALVSFQHIDTPPLVDLKLAGYRVIGLEQSEDAISLPNFMPPEKIALLLGEEVAGISPELLAACDDVIEIPMYGQKESFNVAVAAGMALYHLRTA